MSLSDFIMPLRITPATNYGLLGWVLGYPRAAFLGLSTCLLLSLILLSQRCSNVRMIFGVREKQIQTSEQVCSVCNMIW